MEVRFQGGIIMISNLELHDVPLLEALKSRVNYLKYAPTDEQIEALMRLIASKGWSCGRRSLSPAQCGEVAKYLIAESYRLGIRLDLRMLVDKAFPDFAQHANGQTECHWRDLVTMTLQEQLLEPQHALKRLGRNGRKAANEQLVREVLAQYPSRAQQVKAWEEKTGTTGRTFYRHCEAMGILPKPIVRVCVKDKRKKSV